MSKRLIFVRPHHSIYKAVLTMVKHNISGLVVVEFDELVGIITMRDIFKKVIARDLRPKKVAVKELMSKPVLTIRSNDIVESAVKMMQEKKVKRIVVLNSENRPCGIVTVMDIVEKLPELMHVMFDTWVQPGWK